MQKTNNLQDRFLLRARKTRAHVTVFLINGYGALLQAMTPLWWSL